MAAQRRFSRQREAVLSDLKARSDHPTADEVFASVRRQVPNISLGTVYRNLRELGDGGEIKVFTHFGRERFDGDNSYHLHFCCSKCGGVQDIPPERGEAANREIERLIGCKIHDTVIYGVCKKCLNINNF